MVHTAVVFISGAYLYVPHKTPVKCISMGFLHQTFVSHFKKELMYCKISVNI